MKKEILNHFANPDWILLSFLLFLGVFLFMVFRELFLRTPKEHQRNSLIPLYEKPIRKAEHHE